MIETVNNVRAMMDLAKNSSRIITHKCNRCKDLGFIVVYESGPVGLYPEEIRQAKICPVKYICPECQGEQAAIIENAKKIATIPHSFYDAMLMDFKWNIYKNAQGQIINTSDLKKIVDSFVDDFGKWRKYGVGLYIHSRMRGSGKTFLASCICNEIIARYSISPKFVKATELIDIAKGAKDSGTEYDRDPIKLLCNCELLCIDDLGQKQAGIEWTNDILFRITDERMQNKKVTLFTSNVSILDLQADDRITDRINSLCQQIPLPEYCVRNKANEQRKSALFSELGF